MDPHSHTKIQELPLPPAPAPYPSHLPLPCPSHALRWKLAKIIYVLVSEAKKSLSLFSATYDLQVGTYPHGISIRQIPKLSSITMCFWPRFPAATPIDNKSYYRMIYYYVSGNRYQEFAINWSPNRERTTPGMQVIFRTWKGTNYIDR